MSIVFIFELKMSNVFRFEFRKWKKAREYCPSDLDSNLNVKSQIFSDLNFKCQTFSDLDLKVLDFWFEF